MLANNKDEKSKIYVRDEAALIVGMFEDILEKHDIRVPSEEDDEREPNDVGLYGCTYYDLLDGVENQLAALFNRHDPNTVIVRDKYSGTV